MTRFDEWWKDYGSRPGNWPPDLPDGRARDIWLAALREAAKMACRRCSIGRPVRLWNGGYMHPSELNESVDGYQCTSSNIHREIELMETQNGH